MVFVSLYTLKLQVMMILMSLKRRDMMETMVISSSSIYQRSLSILTVLLHVNMHCGNKNWFDPMIHNIKSFCCWVNLKNACNWIHWDWRQKRQSILWLNLEMLSSMGYFGEKSQSLQEQAMMSLLMRLLNQMDHMQHTCSHCKPAYYNQRQPTQYLPWCWEQIQLCLYNKALNILSKTSICLRESGRSQVLSWHLVIIDGGQGLRWKWCFFLPSTIT